MARISEQPTRAPQYRAQVPEYQEPVPGYLLALPFTVLIGPLIPWEVVRGQSCLSRVYALRRVICRIARLITISTSLMADFLSARRYSVAPPLRGGILLPPAAGSAAGPYAAPEMSAPKGMSLRRWK